MIGSILAVAMAAGGPQVFENEPLAQEVLAEQRGGIRLPNGIDANISIQTRTAIDGKVVLQTVVSIQQGPPVVQVYVPKTGEIITLPSGAVRNYGNNRATISYDRNTGLQVVMRGGALPVAVNFGGGSQSFDLPDGLQLIDPVGQTVTDHGLVTGFNHGGRSGVELSREDLNIVHLTGHAFGSVIANTANDRAIDTETVLSIDLRNAGPDVLGSTMLRVENIGIDALSTRF